MKNSEVFDAIVIGSGPAGASAVHYLIKRGFKVALIDRGSPFNSPYPTDLELPKDIYEVQSQSEAYNKSSAHLFANDVLDPYEQDQSKFAWIRSHSLGGRSNLWNGLSHRFSPIDMKPYSFDGEGIDWPISFDDLLPHYKDVETLLNVNGESNINHAFFPKISTTCREKDENELFLLDLLGKRYSPICESIKTLNNPFKAFNVKSLIDQADQMGELTYLYNHVCEKLTFSPGKVKVECSHVSKNKRVTYNAGKVFLACSTIESTRILLNSNLKKEDQSDSLGNYLMGHLSGASGIKIIGMFLNQKKKEDFSVTKKTFVIPRHHNLHPLDYKKNGFRRGYHILINIEQRDRHRIFFGIVFFGEVLPQKSNSVSVNPNTRDAWGNPVAKIKFNYGANEVAMFESMRSEYFQILKLLNSNSSLKITSQIDNIGLPGLCNHEVGTARMGNSIKEGFLNDQCSPFNIENLHVIDGSWMPSSGNFGPTLTLMSMAKRVTEAI